MTASAAVSGRTALDRSVLARAGVALAIAAIVLVCFGVVPAAFALLAGAAVTALGWAQTRLVDGPAATALRLLLIAGEVGIVTVAVFAGDPLGPRLPAPLVFASPGLICLLAVITVNAATVRPLAVWWAGGCVAAAWGLAAALTRADPTTVTKFQINDDNYPTCSPIWRRSPSRISSASTPWRCNSPSSPAVRRSWASPLTACGRWRGPQRSATRRACGAFFILGGRRPAQLARRGRRPPPSRRGHRLRSCGFHRLGCADRGRRGGQRPSRLSRLRRGTGVRRGGAVLKYVGDGVVAVFA
ncbi:MAG: hypothetical protein WDM92_00095 [Caulobacteraceae bacterium]